MTASPWPEAAQGAVVFILDAAHPVDEELLLEAETLAGEAMRVDAVPRADDS